MTATSLSRGDMLRIATVVLIWGLNFVVMKLGLQGLSPMLLGALRFSVAGAAVLVLWRRPPLPWRYLAAYGLAQGLGQFGLLFLGLQLGMTAGMASVVMQTQAFFTLLLGAPLLGERAGGRQWAGLAVALAGLVAIAAAHGDGPGQMTLVGFLLTVGAAFMWAVSNIVGRLALKHGPYDPLAFIAWSSLVPVLPFLALAVWQQGHDAVREQMHALQWPAMLAVLYLGLLATLLAYSLWTRLLMRHSPAQVAPWSLLVPVVGLWAAAAAFGEQPTPLQWAGSAAVLLGLAVNQGLLQRWARRAQPNTIQ